MTTQVAQALMAGACEHQAEGALVELPLLSKHSGVSPEQLPSRCQPPFVTASIKRSCVGAKRWTQIRCCADAKSTAVPGTVSNDGSVCTEQPP